jgi:hypothetical protein
MKSELVPSTPGFGSSRFLLLTLSLFGLLLVYPFWSRSALGLATSDLVFWSVILASIYAVSRRPWSFVVGLALAVPALGRNIALYFYRADTLVLVSCLLDLVFVTGVVIGHVIRQESRSPPWSGVSVGGSCR